MGQQAEVSDDLIKMTENKADGTTVVDLVKCIEKKGPIHVFVSHKQRRGLVITLIELDGIFWPHVKDPMSGRDCGIKTGSSFTLED